MEFLKAKNISMKALSFFLKTLLCIFVYFFFAFTVPDLISKALEGGQKVILAADQSVLLFDDVSINIEKVTTEEERQIGLSKYSKFPAQNGMLFVFDRSDYYSIWMKDMKFPIDIIWLDETMKIVDIEKDVAPETFPESFTPKQKSKYILEVNAGFADKNFLKLGDQGTIFKKS